MCVIGVVGKDPLDTVLSQRWQHRHLLCGPVRIDTEVEDLRAVDVRVGGDRRHVQALVRGALLAVGAPRVELSIREPELAPQALLPHRFLHAERLDENPARGIVHRPVVLTNWLQTGYKLVTPNQFTVTFTTVRNPL